MNRMLKTRISEALEKYIHWNLSVCIAVLFQWKCVDSADVGVVSDMRPKSFIIVTKVMQVIQHPIDFSKLSFCLNER